LRPDFLGDELRAKTNARKISHVGAATRFNREGMPMGTAARGIETTVNGFVPGISTR
jgi:hypothetical protein